MKHPVLFLVGAAAVLATIVLVAERHVARNTTKIDEQVTIVTLDEYVVVMQRGSPTQVTRIRPPVVPAKNVKVEKSAPNAPSTMKWTLPFSCNDARYYNAHFTRTQLEAMRAAAGMKLPSGEQQKQIQACIAGRLPTG